MGADPRTELSSLLPVRGWAEGCASLLGVKLSHSDVQKRRLVPRWSGARFAFSLGLGPSFSAGISVAPWSRVEAVDVYAVSWLLPRGVAPSVGWCPGGVSLAGVCPASWSGACRCAGGVSSVAFLGSCGWAVFPLVGGSGEGVCPAIFRLAGRLAVFVFSLVLPGLPVWGQFPVFPVVPGLRGRFSMMD